MPAWEARRRAICNWWYWKPDSQALHQSAGYIDGSIQKRGNQPDTSISANGDYSRYGSCHEGIENAGQEEVPSAWKMDLVIYPDLFLENNTFDELYTYAINLNPAVEMALWKGGKMTAQVILPVATNLSGEMKRIRPGIIALSQDVRFRHNIFGKMTVGNFTNNRYGAQLEIKYRTNNGRWELGGTAGSTGFSAITREDGWYIGRKQRINASLNASYYEPRLNLQFDLKAGRYIYGDYGVRGDCTRHFGEYAIGLYALCTDGEINGGFHFAIPLPGKNGVEKDSSE